MRAVLVVIVISFLSITDDRRCEGAGIVVGPRALVVFSCLAASIWVALLTDAPVTFPGSLTTYEVVPLRDTSPTRWGVRVMVFVGRGACTLRPARKTVRVAIRSVVAASCQAASYFLYALTWASCCRGRVGAGIDDVDSFLGEGAVLLP